MKMDVNSNDSENVGSSDQLMVQKPDGSQTPATPEQIIGTIENKNQQINDVTTKLYNLLLQKETETMSGPSTKIYFDNNDEREILTYYARLNGMSLSQFILNATRSVAQSISDKIVAENAAAQNKTTETPETDESDDVAQQ
jgi:hypothetical protein